MKFPAISERLVQYVLTLLCGVFVGGLASPTAATAGSTPVDDAIIVALPPSSTPVWSELAPTGATPGVRRQHATVYDPIRHQMLTIGGIAGQNQVLSNDVWRLSLGSELEWSALTRIGTAPTPRRGHSAIYDATNDRVIVFGGYDGTYRTDTWQLTVSGGSVTWTPIVTAGTPPEGSYGHCAIFDPVRDRMVVFGGDGGPTASDRAWALSLSGPPTWTEIVTTGARPARRTGHIGIYDPNGDRMVVFGGMRPGTEYDDTWALNLDGTPQWTAIQPTGVLPESRHFPSAIYDPIVQQLVLFGGWDGDDAFNDLDDTWALPLIGEPVWKNLTAGTRPEKRWGMGVVYDAASDRLILFAGGDEPNYDDTWEMDWLVRPARFNSEEPIASAGASTAVPALGPVLAGASPNPFQQSTTIRFSLSVAAPARLDVFDVSGRRVRALVNGSLPMGEHEARWAGDVESGARAASGVYFLRLESPQGTATRKVFRR